MQVSSVIRQHLFLVVLVMFMIPISCEDLLSEQSSSSGDSSQEDQTHEQSDLCSEPIPATVAVLAWPPYTGNDNSTNEWEVKAIIELLNAAVLVSKDKLNVTFIKAPNEGNVDKLFKTNKTDLCFPLIKGTGDDTKDTHLRYHPGLEYLVVPHEQSPGAVCIKTLFDSWPLLALSLILTGMAGMVLWLLEVFSNREEFPRSFARGSWEGFWWAFISMTTVGYGDKCPRSVAGRCFAVLWIFAGLILVTLFMANVTTALTSVSVKPEYKLGEAEVGVVKNSLEVKVAKEHDAEVKAFENYDELMRAFVDERVSGILMDHYTACLYLKNVTGPFRQKILRSKHISLDTKYNVVAASTKNYDQKNQKSVYCKPTSNENYEDPLKKLIKEVMDGYWSEERFIQGLEGIKKSSSAAPQSFNLFLDSKEFLEHATYISLAILAGAIVVGLFVDKMFWNVKSHKTEDHELKVCEDDEIMQDIANGKEMLNQLQLFLQKIENKIHKGSKCEPTNTGRFHFANDRGDEYTT